MKTIQICPGLLALGLFITTITTLHAAPIPGYLVLKETEVEVESEGSNKVLKLEIKTQAPIPVDGKSGAFGYAALTDGGNNLLVLVTHLPIDDSSYEHPESGFHTHVLDLKAPGEACAGADFEVDLANSGKNKAFDADYRWKTKGNKISVKKVPVADLGDAGVESIVSFTLKPILDANNKPTHLCVKVMDQN
ncbi:hypothetical protein AU255_05910 [Methyloprofundus sedimenti]|uniref:Uncharacterized protein n=1 Tax=Methyloprofundus sedimenti TaxID=1420851 RepID=A0A1V8M756_9GAMM|nr:hypothetical protein [Methyloprofundus sedimenti]OQK17414.1 hypothetical protein AU255_05910 [Methyloprofundus sedimenti]